MSNRLRRTLIVGGPLVAIALSGCGVKNLPQAPGTDAPPSGVVEPQRGGSGAIIGASGRATDPLAAQRITGAGANSDDQISAAEVSRRAPGGGNDRFFLDPLLN